MISTGARRRVAVAGAAGVLFLAGCGSGGDDAPSAADTTTAATTSQAAPTTAATTTETTTTTEPPPTTESPATTTLTDVPYEKHEGYYFTSADGSFQCAIVARANGTEAGCEGVTTPVPPKPDNCMVNWGNTVRVGDGQGEFLCTGGAVYTSDTPSAPLPAGSPLTQLGYTCESADASVTCRNDATGHGFTVAPDSNTTF